MAILDPNAFMPGALSPGGPQMATVMGGPPISPAPDAPVMGGPAIPPTQEPSVAHGILGRLKDVGSRVATGFSNEVSTPSGKKGLRAFGAAMLGAPNFWQGLSSGMGAFDETQAAEEALNKPKNQMVADGAFMASTDRQGNTTFSPNTEVQGYQQDLAETAARERLALQDDKQGGAMQLAAMQMQSREEIAAANRRSAEDRAASQRDTRMMVAAMSQAGRNANGGYQRPLGAGIQKMVDKGLESSFTFENTAADIEGLAPALAKVPFGAVNNLKYDLALKTGLGVDDNARAYGDFKTLKEKMRNARLSEFVGVQTEGDANRAMDEILAGSGDPKYIAGRLAFIKKTLDRASQQARFRSNRILRDNGRPDLDGNDFSLPEGSYDGAPAPAPAPSAAPAPKKYGWDTKAQQFRVPEAAKVMLLKNPNMATDFDAKYGKGASAAFLKKG